MKRIVLFAAALIVSSALSAQTWTLDKAHAKLGFTATHMMISDVEGWFKSFDATIISSKEDFSDAVIELTADVSSINTENAQRDTHLKGPDFFDVAKFATLTFKSKSFKQIEGKRYKATGDLTMHGITKAVELEVIFNGTAPQQGSNLKAAGFKVTGSIRRSDFSVGPNMPSAVVSDDIAIMANVEFKQVKAND